MAITDNTFTFLHPMIMIHTALLDPKPYMENGKPKGLPKFQASFVIDPADQKDEWEAFRQHAIMVARAEWPSLDLKTNLSPANGWPWRSGNVMADKRQAAAKAKGKDEDPLAFLRGKAVIRAGSGQEYPPRLYGFETGVKGVVEYVDEQRKAKKSLFRPGMLVLAKVNLKAVIVTNTHYVTAYLNMICSTGKLGMEIQTQKSAAEVFSGYQGHVTNEDPTGGETFGNQPFIPNDIP